jgi:hypothetical protein
VLAADQHIPVYSHENIGDVRAEFYHIAKVGYAHDFEVLRELCAVDDRAPGHADSCDAYVDRVENENQAVDAVECRVDSHVFVKLVLELVGFVFTHRSHYSYVQVKAEKAEERNEDESENAVDEVHVQLENVIFCV